MLTRQNVQVGTDQGKCGRESARAGGSVSGTGQNGTVREAAVDVMAKLRQAGVSRGDLVGLAVAPGPVLGLATSPAVWAEPSAGGPDGDALGGPDGDALGGPDGDALGGLAGQLRRIDRELRPRWVVWSGETAATLTAQQVRLSTSWDVAAVHRLLFGGWRAGPGLAWARLQPGLAPPASGPPDLFQPGDGGDPDQPVGPSGHLRPEWIDGGWRASPERVARWEGRARAGTSRQNAGRAHR